MIVEGLQKSTRIDIVLYSSAAVRCDVTNTGGSLVAEAVQSANGTPLKRYQINRLQTQNQPVLDIQCDLLDSRMDPIASDGWVALSLNDVNGQSTAQNQIASHTMAGSAEKITDTMNDWQVVQVCGELAVQPGETAISWLAGAGSCDRRPVFPVSYRVRVGDLATIASFEDTPSDPSKSSQYIWRFKRDVGANTTDTPTPAPVPAPGGGGGGGAPSWVFYVIGGLAILMIETVLLYFLLIKYKKYRARQLKTKIKGQQQHQRRTKELAQPAQPKKPLTSSLVPPSEILSSKKNSNMVSKYLGTETKRQQSNQTTFSAIETVVTMTTGVFDSFVKLSFTQKLFSDGHSRLPAND